MRTCALVMRRAARLSLAVSIIGIAGVLFLPSAANALSGCKAKADKRTGDIEIKASNVVGTLRWGIDPNQVDRPLIACQGSPTKPKNCLLGPAGTLAGRTAPPGCLVELADDAPSSCSPFIKGCTVGTRFVDGSFDQNDPRLRAAFSLGPQSCARHIIYEGTLQIRDGSGSTAPPNNTQCGNLIIGYNEDSGPLNDRSGSHNLIVGPEHTFRSWGGIVAGFENTISAPGASVTGGLANTASGFRSSVTGGRYGAAIGDYSSVSGGFLSHAFGSYSSVSGGRRNYARGDYSSVSGGNMGYAVGAYSSISGGYANFANGRSASVSGGCANSVDPNAYCGSVSGGQANIANARGASVSGGVNNNALGAYSSIIGGVYNRTYGTYSSVSGGSMNKAYGYVSVVSGGAGNKAYGTNSAVSGGTANVTRPGDNESTVSGGIGLTTTGPFDHQGVPH